MKTLPTLPVFEKLMTVKDISAYLSVSEQTVYDWVFKRQIPFKKVNRMVRFVPSEIAKWLQNGGHNGN